MKSRKLVSILMCLMLVFALFVAGCTSQPGTTSNEGEDSASNSLAKNISGANTTVKTAAPNAKFLWYQAGVHPFFDEMWKGVETFEKDFDVKVMHGVGTNWTQGEEDQLIRAWAAQGYNAMAIFPADPAGANGLYSELVDNGSKVVNFGATTSMPTDASFYFGTDIPNAVKRAATKLADVMEENGVKNGRVLLAIGSLGDLNAQKGKEAAEEVFAQRGITVLEVVSDMSQLDVGQQKMGDAIAAHLSELDGILSTDTNPTDGSIPVLRELYQKNPDQKRIFFIGRDADEVTLQAIRDGIFDGTNAQNAFHMGYSPMIILNYLMHGWTPKEDSYYQYGADIIVTKDNIDTFNQEMIDRTMDWVNSIETDILNPPAK